MLVFGNDDVLVALSNGINFGTARIWRSGFTGWDNNTTVRTVVDVNGDGKADIVGFGNDDVLVALSNGSSFGAATIWNNGFASWDNNTTVRTVVDVTGDEKADIVGFGNTQIIVSPSNGTSFSPTTRWFNN